MQSEKFSGAWLLAAGTGVVMAALTAMWWPFGSGWSASVAASCLGMALVLSFAPWRHIRAAAERDRKIVRLIERASEAMQGGQPAMGTSNALGPAETSEDPILAGLAELLNQLNERERNLEVQLRHERRRTHRTVERETRRATAHLRRQASTDPLTGLGNRREIDAWFEQFSRESTIASDPIAVVLVDLDHFKPVNDQLGHAVGDDCLRFLGQLMRSHVRDHDCALRLGGDEFAMLLTSVAGKHVEGVCQRLASLFGQMPWPHRSIERPSLSFGYAVGRISDLHELHQLINQADTAMYESKRRGRGRINGGLSLRKVA